MNDIIPAWRGRFGLTRSQVSKTETAMHLSNGTRLEGLHNTGDHVILSIGVNRLAFPVSDAPEVARMILALAGLDKPDKE